MLSGFNIYLTSCLAFLNSNLADLDPDTPGVSEKDSLIFVSVMFVHGDAPPVTTFRTDPYGNESVWPVPFGQLTNLGKTQTFELGEWVGKRYVQLLINPPYNKTSKIMYDPKRIYVRSTDVDRTLMSAECNLAGLFPPVGNQVWNDDLLWQPVPVHTVPVELDNMLKGTKPCPIYDIEYNRTIKTNEIIKINSSFKDIYEILNKNTGENINNFQLIDWIYHSLSIEKLNNKTLPPWTKSIFPDRMKQAAIYDMILPTYNKKLARLKSGLLVAEIIRSMVNKMDDAQRFKRRINYYSVHDSTMSNLMNSMGIFNNITPPFSACLMVELWKPPTRGIDWFVAILYRNSSTEKPVLLTVPGCNSLCPLIKLTRLMDPIMINPSDWEWECLGKKVKEPLSFLDYVLRILLAIVAFAIVAVIGAVAFLIWTKYARLHRPPTSQTQETSQTETTSRTTPKATTPAPTTPAPKTPAPTTPAPTTPAPTTPAPMTGQKA